MRKWKCFWLLLIVSLSSAVGAASVKKFVCAKPHQPPEIYVVTIDEERKKLEVEVSSGGRKIYHTLWDYWESETSTYVEDGIYRKESYFTSRHHEVLLTKTSYVLHGVCRLTPFFPFSGLR